MPPDDFASEILAEHNKRRKTHNAPELRWSEELAELAQNWADKLARQAHLSFSEQSGVGENITFFPKDVQPDILVEHWYHEHEKYEYETPGWQSGANYFTQLIWKATEEVGIGRAIVEEDFIQMCKKTNGCNGALAEVGAMVVVAFYRPSGNNNRAGQFAANVHKPVSTMNGAQHYQH